MYIICNYSILFYDIGPACEVYVKCKQPRCTEWLLHGCISLQQAFDIPVLDIQIKSTSVWLSNNLGYPPIPKFELSSISPFLDITWDIFNFLHHVMQS